MQRRRARPRREAVPRARSGRLQGSARWLRNCSIVGCAALLCPITFTLTWPPAPKLLWNASSSSPRGLYLVRSADGLHAGDMAVAWPPDASRRLAASRGYVPYYVPLVKRVAAARGDRVCARGKAVFVNGRALRFCLALAALGWASAVSANPLDRWAPDIAEASLRFQIPESWIRRVMRVESEGLPTLHGKPIVSSAGAMGLMQLMPRTWRDMRAELGLGPNPHDPHDNILAGTAYLRRMYDRFGYPGLFAAYNAGPARYAAHLADGQPLPAETLLYIRKVRGGPAAARVPAGPSRPRLFVPVARPDPLEQPGSLSGPGTLFVQLAHGEAR